MEWQYEKNILIDVLGKGRIAFSDVAQNFDIEESWVREMLQNQVLTSSNDLEVISKYGMSLKLHRLL